MTLSTWAKDKFNRYRAEKAAEQVEIAKASKEADELRERMWQEGRKKALEARLERIRNRPIEEQRRKEMLKQKLSEAAKKAAAGAQEFGKTGGGFGQNMTNPKKYMIRREPYNPFRGL